MGVVIGIAGTAKNTGKTTTLNASARILRRQGQRLALTSIGYDGEDLDTITGLPKPRVFVEKGDLVATALPLMLASRAAFRDRQDTGVMSALGPVYTGVAAAQGKVVLAGATSTEGISAVLETIGPDRVVLLDGALSRMSPMVLTTHLVMATGAARYAYAGFVGQEMEILARVLSFDIYGGPKFDVIHLGGLYDSEQVRGAVAALKACPLGAVAHLPGAVNPGLLARLLADLGPGVAGMTVVFSHPVHLLLSGDSSLWPGTIREAERLGVKLAVERSPLFLGFTISSYVPRFDPATSEYTVSYVAARPFLDEIRHHTGLACTDVILEGSGALEHWLLKAVEAVRLPRDGAIAGQGQS